MTWLTKQQIDDQQAAYNDVRRQRDNWREANETNKGAADIFRRLFYAARGEREQLRRERDELRTIRDRLNVKAIAQAERFHDDIAVVCGQRDRAERLIRDLQQEIRDLHTELTTQAQHDHYVIEHSQNGAGPVIFDLRGTQVLIGDDVLVTWHGKQGELPKAVREAKVISMTPGHVMVKGEKWDSPQAVGVTNGSALRLEVTKR